MTNLDYAILKAKTQQYNPLEQYQTQARSSIELIEEANCNKNKFSMEQFVAWLQAEHKEVDE